VNREVKVDGLAKSISVEMIRVRDYLCNYCATIAIISTEGFGGIAGGLLIHPDLFAQTDFRLFCLRYERLNCTKAFHLQSIAQQMFSNNSYLQPY
jgi:hypothetical protein